MDVNRMCDFCDAIPNSSKKIVWSVRSTFADDNISESLGDDYLEDFSYFKLYGYKYEDNTYVGIDYRQELSKSGRDVVIISPFSETIQFNFCPICGKQISKDIKEFKDYSEHYISVEESE